VIVAAAQAASSSSNAIGGPNPNKMLEAIQKTSGPDRKTTYSSGTGKYTVTAFGTTTEKTPEEMAKLAELNMDDFKSLAATTDATIQTGAADVKLIGAITKATAPTDITAAATAQQKGTAVVTGEPALGVPEGFSTEPKPGKLYTQEHASCRYDVYL
jgi:alpha-D-ribose 1-methylphosphonate 5-triphosphate diphosphatase PhnM